LKAKNLGEKQVQWRLRDWGLSRQRYWGCPVPIVHCADCGDVPVPDNQLPVLLPEHLVPDGTGNPLAKLPSFYERTCPSCGKPAKRETDTMDTRDLSWYFARYACPGTGDADERAVPMAVDQYIGGIEHAILHPLFALLPASDARRRMLKVSEPFPTCSPRAWCSERSIATCRGPARMGHRRRSPSGTRRGNPGQEAGWRGGAYGGIGTMSKSRNNGVDPQELIEKYGADTARFFIIFASPPTSTLEWSDEGVEGSYRFLKRLWAYCAKFDQAGPELKAGLEKPTRFEIHAVLKQANYDLRTPVQHRLAR
jgi:leucyl-tRNA synthetase